MYVRTIVFLKTVNQKRKKYIAKFIKNLLITSPQKFSTIFISSKGCEWQFQLVQNSKICILSKVRKMHSYQP
jgi:hypothetical protein